MIMIDSFLAGKGRAAVVAPGHVSSAKRLREVWIADRRISGSIDPPSKPRGVLFGDDA
jgi:hypothetical protein